ncbi:KamA family radical SAM protein [Methylorubrum thiocyanatum]|uniref:KamA family radical SAM protein n=1 Tax=Methylorubrum thiocyanatum TaxID=47958 RepID=UPI003F81844E
MSMLSHGAGSDAIIVPSSVLQGKTHSKPITYNENKIDHIPQSAKIPGDLLEGIRLAAMVFPFKVNDYSLDNLIDWTRIPDDPMFRLLFPHPDMLGEENLAALSRLTKSGASRDLISKEVLTIRNRLNPHSSNQTANIPTFNDQKLDGIQHKYEQTALFFPKQGQTCHSYCTFCFRWPQFVASDAIKFGSDDADTLHCYLREHQNLTDLLITGGDPMVMNARRLRAYLEPLMGSDFRHVSTIRFGTKALTYWPYRFLSEADSDDLLALIRDLSEAGKHVAIMAHVNHWREMVPEPFQQAVHRLQQAGATIRSQSPLVGHVNADSGTWQRLWTDQVRQNIIPYYMFMERDTGANHYFGVPISRALSIYQEATSHLSGLAKTARGPVMSAGPGKIHVLGTMEHNGKKHFVLTFLQARRTEWLGKPFLAAYSETAQWLDQLLPSDGNSTFFFEHQYKEFLNNISMLPTNNVHQIEKVGSNA